MSLYRIDKLFNFEQGTLQSSKCEPGSYTFITASAEWKTHNNFSYDCEALVFAAAASGSLGRTHYVNGKFIASDLCFVLTPKDPAKFPIDLRFYHIIFNELRSDIVKNTKAGTSKEAISLGNFARYELPYFEIEKQIEIKNQFVHSEKTKETLTAEFTRQLDFVKQLRQSFLREAMQGKLTPQDPKDEPASELLQKIKAALRQAQDEKKGKKQKELPPVKENEIPFEIPENWVWCRLGDLCWVTKLARFEYTKYIKLQTEGEIPVVRAQNVKPNKILEDNLLYIDRKISLKIERSALIKKSLLITFIGAGIGEIAIFDKSERWHLAPNVAKAEPLIESLSIEYLMWFLLSDFGKDEFFKISKATAQPSLSMGTIREVCIPLPPLPEQHRIVTKLEQLMQLCDELESSIRQSKEQTNMLLQSALREALKGDEAEAPKE